jgi:glycyl-tRNA synthetase alpha chain
MYLTLKWNDTITYRDVYHQQEVEQSTYNFEIADVDLLFDLFQQYEAEAHRIVSNKDLVLPAYEYVFKMFPYL